MNRYIFIAAVLLLVAGCASSSVVDAIIGCRAYDATLRSLAGYRAAGKLTGSQVATVDKWRAVINPICLSVVLPADGPALDVLEEGLIALTVLDKEVSR